MQFENKNVHADLVVVGAGAPGLCAAIQAARQGLNVVLINDRGCVGGNCGMEIFVSCSGANDGNSLNINLREGGIIDELRVEYKYRSVPRDRFALDGVYMDAIEKENIHLYLNTLIDSVTLDESGHITSVSGSQNTTETHFTFFAPIYIDDTGDGTLGALAGADYMLGRESKDTFGEKIAPEQADTFVIPSTLTFFAHNTGKPVSYIAPDYAIDIEKSGALRFRQIPHDTFYNFQWFYEGDGALDQVKDRETIIRSHKALVYGIWNYIKNSGLYPEAENYALNYVSVIPGMREYRRLCGDVILTENELVNQQEFEDAVGHGGWNIDLHAIRGFFDDDLVNRHINFRGAYQIPLRAGYSRNIDNLFMCGRCMSTSHVAFGSTRVAATLSTLGQAEGMAAYLCKKYSILPREVYKEHASELQQLLLREDQLILGVRNSDIGDVARLASASASSDAVLTLNTADSIVPIGEGVALELPLDSQAEYIEVLAKCDTCATICYRLYRPLKPYNFGPDELICSGEACLAHGNNFQTIRIPLPEKVRSSYCFIELISNDNVEFSASNAPLPNTVQYRRYKNTGKSNWSYSAMGMMDYGYSRSKTCIDFSIWPEQHAYAAANVLNGYNRACGGTNMWLSDKNDAKPELIIAWEKPVTIGMAQITFAIDTSYDIEHYPKSVFDRIAIDYKLYGCIGDKKELLKEVKGNHSKRNRLLFKKGSYDKVVFEFLKCEGGQAGVYEVRAEA